MHVIVIIYLCSLCLFQAMFKVKNYSGMGIIYSVEAPLVSICYLCSICLIRMLPSSIFLILFTDTVCQNSVLV